MTDTARNPSNGISVGDILGVVIEPQTYKNLLYLIVAFPLGLAYYVTLTVGLSLGIGLAVLLVGFPILFGTLLGVRAIASFERKVANALLGTQIRRPSDVPDGDGLIETATGHLQAASTWKGLGFVLVKFWFGIISFVLVVSLLGTALELLLTPVAPGLLEIQVGGIEIESLVETPTEMVIGVLVGIVMTIASLHVLNGLASVTERVAVSLLGPGEEPPRGDQ
jgi:hypothetical protein